MPSFSSSSKWTICFSAFSTLTPREKECMSLKWRNQDIMRLWFSERGIMIFFFVLCGRMQHKEQVLYIIFILLCIFVHQFYTTLVLFDVVLSFSRYRNKMSQCHEQQFNRPEKIWVFQPFSMFILTTMVHFLRSLDLSIKLLITVLVSNLLGHLTCLCLQPVLIPLKVQMLSNLLFSFYTNTRQGKTSPLYQQCLCFWHKY